MSVSPSDGSIFSFQSVSSEQTQCKQNNNHTVMCLNYMFHILIYVPTKDAHKLQVQCECACVPDAIDDQRSTRKHSEGNYEIIKVIQVMSIVNTIRILL